MFGDRLFAGRKKAADCASRRCGFGRSVRADLLRCFDLVLHTVTFPLDDHGHFFWSSYQLYLLPPSQRPHWLSVQALLGDHGIPKDSAAGRRQFALRMEQRRRSEDKRQWEPLRRGWFLGEESFRQELLARMSQQTGENH